MRFRPRPAFPRFAVGEEQSTRGPKYHYKKTASADFAYYFGKGLKAITNYQSERVHVKFEQEEPDSRAAPIFIFRPGWTQWAQRRLGPLGLTQA